MELSAKTAFVTNSPFGNMGFLQICSYKNIISNGADVYQTMVNTIPGLGESSSKDESSVDRFSNALDAFDAAVKKEFSNTQKAYDESSEPMDTFYLPLPNSIAEQYGQSFEPSTFNLDNSLLSGGMQKMLGKMQQFSPGVTGMLEDVIDTTKHLGARGNATIDPNLINVYNGSLPRAYSYIIDIIPNNIEEVENTLNIINRLFKLSLGVKSNIVLNAKTKLHIGIIKAPHIFTIDYYTVDAEGSYAVNEYMSKLLNTGKKSSGFFLRDISVDLGQGGDNIQLYDLNGKVEYNAEEDLYTISSDTTTFKVPKIINIQISFAEYRPLYANDWDDVINKEKSE